MSMERANRATILDKTSPRPRSRMASCQEPQPLRGAPSRVIDDGGTPAKDNPSSAWPSIEDVEPEYQAEYADCVNKIQDIVKKSRDFRLRQRYEEEMVLKMSKASSDAQRLDAKLKTAMNEDQAAGERCARIEEICLAAEQLVASSTASLAAAKEVAAEAETARHAAQAKRRATKVKVKEIKERKRKADKHVHRLKRQRCEDYTDHNKAACEALERLAPKEELTDNLHPPGVVMQATGAREDLQAQVQGPVQGPAAEAAKAPAAPMPSGAAAMSPTQSTAKAAAVLVEMGCGGRGGFSVGGNATS